MIKITDISKRYEVKTGSWPFIKTQVTQANQNISFECQPGKIHGLLGVNGAGKSTALKILSGLIKSDSGQITVNDINVNQHPQLAQQQMGIFLNSDGLYPKLTARENIRLFADMHQLPDADKATDNIIEELHLRPIAERRTEGFSTGQKMKVALARALVHNPKYVILDEPTRGLDVMSIKLLREYLLKLKAKGCCVLFSSHVMQEVEKVCDAITIIHDGQVQFDGNVETLKSNMQDQDLENAFMLAVGA